MSLESPQAIDETLLTLDVKEGHALIAMPTMVRLAVASSGLAERGSEVRRSGRKAEHFQLHTN